MVQEHNIIGKRMREAMDSRGLTSGQIAERMGVTDGTVRGWTTGRRAISIDSLQQFASIVGYPIEYFVKPGYKLPADFFIRQEVARLTDEVSRLSRRIEEERPTPRPEAPEVPDDVKNYILQARTREEKIALAFEYLCTIPDLRFGSTSMGKYPTEARLGIVRMYERLTGRKILPDDVI